MTRQSYTAEVFSKTLLLLQHRNCRCQHQDHWESQQEWTFSDPLLAFFILYSTNQIWKDLVIKKHELEKWRSWWSSIESAWVFHTCLRRCGLVFTVFLGKEKKNNKQQQEHLGKVDATFYLMVLCSVTSIKEWRLSKWTVCNTKF